MRPARSTSAGKIDLNRAPEALIKGLFVVLGMEENEATALPDRRPRTFFPKRLNRR